MDPYSVLGISRSATDAEVKSKYRELSRKYHPDANIGNPNQKAYEEKFKEVQQAYQAIMDERQGKTSGTGNSAYGFNGYNRSDTYESQDDQYMSSAISYLQNGYFREAINVLNSVKDRKASWYYYSGYANYNLGNNAIAMEQASTAVRMEPNNPYYRQLLNQMQGGGYRYQERTGSYGGSPVSGFRSSGSAKSICLALALANCLCGGAGYGFGCPIICCL